MLAKDHADRTDDARTVHMICKDHKSAWDKIRRVFADREDTRTRTGNDTGDRLGAFFRLERERHKRLVIAGLARGLLKDRNTASLGNDLGIDDVCRFVKDLLKHAFDPKPGHILQILLKVGDLTEVGKLHFRNCPVGDLGSKASHLLCKKRIRIDLGFDFRRYERCIHRALCRTSFQDIDTLMGNGNRHILLGFDRACSKVRSNDH